MDSAHPPLFSAHLRRTGTSHTMNHIITRVVTCWPFPPHTLTSPVTCLQHKDGVHLRDPASWGRGQHPQAPPHTHKVKVEGRHQILMPQCLNADTPPAGGKCGSVLSLEISASSWLRDES